MNNDFHEDARALILDAAERSGLLRDVAEFIWFTQQHKEMAQEYSDAALSHLRDMLTDASDDHIVLTGITAENIWGVDISPAPGSAEAAKFERFYESLLT